MAWLDDRIGTHPKIGGLSDRAFRVWVNGLCYSSGFRLRGVLQPSHQRTIGASPQTRSVLVKAGLWDDLGDGSVQIHDWAIHNYRRDARKAADDQKRRERLEVLSGGESQDVIHTRVRELLTRSPDLNKTQVLAKIGGHRQWVFDSFDLVKNEVAGRAGDCT